MTSGSLIDRCQAALSQHWEEVSEAAAQGQLVDYLDEDAIIEAIRRCVNSSDKTYRYVLPTQLVAKVVDPSLDCRCLQVTRGGPGAFNARTLADKVVVPFDSENERVLGGSPEPYTNNALRNPEITSSYRSARKNKRGWDDLCRVLDVVEKRNDASYTEAVFRQVLKEVYARLQTVGVAYPVPRRISLSQTLGLVESFFVTEKSGGDRFEAVTAALFLSLGTRFHLFDRVDRSSTTTADAPSGMIADLHCVKDDGEIVFVVEAKDREFTITQVQGKVTGLRQRKVSEAFFVATRGIASADEQAIRELIDREFAAGQNIYVIDFNTLAQTILALLGEAGRHEFLGLVGAQLDAYSDVPHRRDWARLLADV